MNFKLFEKLGRMDDVEKTTDIIWEEYKNAPDDKPFEMENITSGDFKIKKITINHYNDNERDTHMSFLFRSKIDNGDYYIYMTRNTFYKKLKTELHHELVHAYEYLKVKANRYNTPDKSLEPFDRIQTNDEVLEQFLYIMYLIDSHEIKAFYNESISFIKDNKQKFRKFQDILKNTELYKNYQYIKEFNIDVIGNSTSIEGFVELYYDIRRNRFLKTENLLTIGFKYYKNYFLSLFKKKKVTKISDNEIGKFIGKFKKEIEFKKRIYIKYIGRLQTLMEY